MGVLRYFLIGNGCFYIGNECFLIGNGCFYIGDVCFRPKMVFLRGFYIGNGYF
jgi:hypothetical protein